MSYLSGPKKRSESDSPMPRKVHALLLRRRPAFAAPLPHDRVLTCASITRSRFSAYNSSISSNLPACIPAASPIGAVLMALRR